MGPGDLLRKIISFALLIAAVVALIGFFIGSGTLVFDPIIDAFDPFNFADLGTALYNAMYQLGIPLIMIMLGIIGLTVDK